MTDMSSRRPRTDGRAAFRWLLPLLAVALGLRLYQALGTTYVWDEDRDWIAIAEGISLDPASLHLPVREGQHPALPAYFIRAGAEIAGHGFVGHRLFSLVAGVLSVGLIALAGLRWGGPAGGLFAGVLLTFNEYHVAFSALAMARIFYLTFGLVSILAFLRFLEDERPRDLYGAMGAAALAFLCKETAVLLVLVGAGTLLAFRPAWYRRREPYLAALLFLAIVSPDLWWQLRPDRTGFEAGYGDHLGRISGIGVTYQPWVFFGRDAVRAALEVVGRPFVDTAAEYPTMNPLFGLTLLGGTALCTLGLRRRLSPGIAFLAACVWVPLIFFTFVQTRSTELLLAAVAWNWVDIALLPGTLLAALWIAGSEGWRRGLAGALVLAAVAVSVARTVPGRLDFSPAALGACPDELVPLDGRWVPVRMEVQGCATCGLEMDELILEDIFLLRGGERESLIGSDLVRGADIGTRDRRFELRAEASGDGRAWFYHVAYRVPSRSVDGSVPSIGTSIVATPEPARKARFWACPDAAEASVADR